MNYIDVVVLSLIVLGALCGFIRGGRYGFISLLFNIIIVGVSFVVCAFFARDLFNQVIPALNIENLASLDDLPSYLSTNENEMLQTIGKVFVEETDMAIVLTEFGLTIVRLVLFLSLVVSLLITKMALSILFYILGLIFKLLFAFQRKKKKSKKRLKGALFGACASFIMSLALVTPVVGLYSVSKKAMSSDFVKEQVGDTEEYFKMIEESQFLGSVNSLIDPAFDMLTGFIHNGKTYTLREELNNFIDLALILEDADLLNGIGDIATFTPREMADKIASISTIVGALEKQGLLKAILPTGLKITCAFSEEMCDTLGLKGLDVSEINFETERDALLEFAAIFNFLDQNPAVPEPTPYIRAADVGLDIGNIGYGIPEEITEKAAAKVIAFLHNEINENGDAIEQAAQDEDNIAINRSVLLDTLVPNLLKQVYSSIIESVASNPDFNLPIGEGNVSNELVGIVTFVKLIIPMQDLMDADGTDATAIDTTVLKKALEELASIPPSMTRQTIDIIFTSQAQALFANGNTGFQYRWENVSVLDNVSAFIALIDMANSFNNLNKDITELDVEDIEGLINNLADALESEFVGEILDEMIKTAVGDNEIPIDIDYTELPKEDVIAAADIFTRLKTLKEAGPGQRELDELVLAAEDLSKDAVALNFTFNSGTRIPTNNTEYTAIFNRMDELYPGISSQKNAICYIFAEEVV